MNIRNLLTIVALSMIVSSAIAEDIEQKPQVKYVLTLTCKAGPTIEVGANSGQFLSLLLIASEEKISPDKFLGELFSKNYEYIDIGVEFFEKCMGMKVPKT